MSTKQKGAFFVHVFRDSPGCHRGKSELWVFKPGCLETFLYNKYKYIWGFSFLWTETKIALFSTSMHSYKLSFLMTNYNSQNNAKL